MDLRLALLSIIGTLTVGAMSPGPSFIMVAQKSISLSRRDGIACALGMGLGATVFCLLAVLGLHTVLTAVPLLYAIFKVVGGCYILFLASRIWQGARAPLHATLTIDGHSNLRKSFSTGLLTQLSNPKTAIVFASTFAALLPATVGIGQTYILVPIIFLIDFGWYTFVAFVLSSAGPRHVYMRAKLWIDHLAATVLAGLGLKLIYDALLA